MNQEKNDPIATNVPELPENQANLPSAEQEYVPLSQEECDRLQYDQGGWTRKFREAHKLGWDAARKAHETDLPKL
jgi:hypothetical protein